MNTVDLKEGIDTKDYYFIGALPNSPLQNVDVGGQDFPLFTEEIIGDEGTGTTHRNRLTGKVVKLLSKQIEKIRKSLEDKYVEWNSNQTRGSVYVKTEFYEPASNHEPLSKYIYMVRLDDIKNNPLWRNDYPPSLWDMENQGKSKKKD